MQEFADEHGLFLDKKGHRPSRRGKTVAWVDLYGNTHNLDFVLERNGSLTRTGTPVAFIETAWRRYTKHSRNKAQEIQGAIVPLVTTHQNAAPFVGAILAGVFTDGAVAQLRSLGFTVLYLPYATVVGAFGQAGIDAHFDEETADGGFSNKVHSWEMLSEAQQRLVPSALLHANSAGVQQFMDALHRAVTRRVQSIRVLPLHGSPLSWQQVDDAIGFIESYDEKDVSSLLPIVRYEIEVVYINGDRIQGQFADKVDAITFLRSCQPHPLLPAG